MAKKSVRKFISELLLRLFESSFKARVFFYRLKNSNKQSILIWTDSRGHEITKLKNKHNPFSGFCKYFIKNYKCYVYVCPEKHTTFYDFLYFLKHKKKKFDYIISYIGVVDFAPRTRSQANETFQLKRLKVIDLFGQEIFEELINAQPYSVTYQGEPTVSLVPEFLIPKIADKMNQYENMIWISCTPIDVNWQGNYSKERPANSNMVNSKSVALIKYLKTDKIINFTNLENDELKRLTCDNVHLTEAGMLEIENRIREIIA